MNNYDEGIQEDFDNMTEDLGREVEIFLRVNTLNYEGQEGEDSDLGPSNIEIVFLQELDSTHEMVQSGQLNVGDVKLTFQHNSIAEEEGYIKADGNIYKILKLTKLRGMNNNAILEIKGTGKKLPNR